MSTNRVDRNQWPHTAPSGHLYEIPTTYEELKRQHEDAALAMVEAWDEAEHPPEPRWEHLEPAHRRIQGLENQITRLARGNRELRKIIDAPDHDLRWRYFTIGAVSFGLGALARTLFGP